MKQSPLPFPELPEKILQAMARRPDAPSTARTLLEQLFDEPEFNGLLALDDIGQSLTRLLEAGLVFDKPEPISSRIVWKLTTRGKLNHGIS